LTNNYPEFGPERIILDILVESRKNVLGSQTLLEHFPFFESKLEDHCTRFVSEPCFAYGCNLGANSDRPIHHDT